MFPKHCCIDIVCFFLVRTRKTLLRSIDKFSTKTNSLKSINVTMVIFCYAADETFQFSVSSYPVMPYIHFENILI